MQVDKSVPFPIFFSISLIFMIVIAGSEYYYLNANSHKVNDRIAIHGSLKIYNGGVLVYNASDLVTYMSYDYLFCKIFNDSTACGQASNGFTGAIGGNAYCKFYGSSGSSVASTFYSAELCSAVGVELGNPSTTPTINAATNACPSILTTSNLSPVKATTTHTASTNNILLTATWTPSADVNNVQVICLAPWSDVATTGIVYGAGTYQDIIAIDLFTPQTLSNGVPFTAQWTFSL
jgi:hypothetical protein